MWCEKLSLPTRGNKSALVLQLQSVLPSVSASKLSSCASKLPSGVPDDENSEDDKMAAKSGTSKDNNDVIIHGVEIQGQRDGNAQPTLQSSNDEQNQSGNAQLNEGNGNDHMNEESGNDQQSDESGNTGSIFAAGNTVTNVKNANNTANKNETIKPQCANFDFKTAKEFVPEYDGEKDINEWLTVVKSVRAVFNIADDVMRPIICSRAKGKANYWLLSQPSLLSGEIDDIFAQMQIRFGAKGNFLELRHKLEKRKWQWDEMFASYYYDKLLLASKINVKDDELVQYILDGIPNVQLKNQAKLQRFSTPAAVLDAFPDIKMPRSSTGKIEAVQKALTPDQRVTKCFNCNSVGHMAAECHVIVYLVKEAECC
ncbi:hypothetical protein ACLKA7_000961 [Drosophila subpalustris]